VVGLYRFTVTAPPPEELLWQGKFARYPMFDHADRFVLPMLAGMVGPLGAARPRSRSTA
jgi:hypothetical protein